MSRTLVRTGIAVGTVGIFLHVSIDAQDRLKSMPGYARYDKMSREIPSAVKSGALGVVWSDAHSIEYPRDGKRYRYDVLTRTAAEIASTSGPEPSGRGGRGGPLRGRQVDASLSPDGKLKASYRDRNLWLSDATGAGETAITSDGSEKARIKDRYGQLGVRRRTVADDRNVVVAG